MLSRRYPVATLLDGISLSPVKARSKGAIFMHYYNDMGFFGMHFFWWVFWVVGMFTLFAMFEPVPRKGNRRIQTPLDILQKRYASGEINDEEYEKKKSRLERDLKSIDLSKPSNA
jgi:putative membrane protein